MHVFKTCEVCEAAFGTASPCCSLWLCPSASASRLQTCLGAFYGQELRRCQVQGAVLAARASHGIRPGCSVREGACTAPEQPVTLLASPPRVGFPYGLSQPHFSAMPCWGEPSSPTAPSRQWELLLCATEAVSSPGWTSPGPPATSHRVSASTVTMLVAVYCDLLMFSLWWQTPNLTQYLNRGGEIPSFGHPSVHTSQDAADLHCPLVRASYPSHAEE